MRTIGCRNEGRSRGTVTGRQLQWSGQLMPEMAGEIEILEMYVREKERESEHVCLCVF